MKRLLLPEAPGALRYAATAGALIAVQYGFAALALLSVNAPFISDRDFWLFPIRTVATVPDAGLFLTIAGFALCLLVAALLVALSLRRAAALDRGGMLALITMVPTFQILAVLALTLLPRRRVPAPESAGRPVPPYQMAIGILAGMALIVTAVAASALTFGSYGWGLFVMTPFLVGLVTGFMVNRGLERSKIDTLNTVAITGLLGTLALLMLALEGFMCIMLIAPLAIVLAAIGGLAGRAAAKQVNPRQPFYSIAILPLLFAFDAAMPPEIPVVTRTAITIAAPPEAVWQSLTADRPVAEAPGIVGLAGLAYPVASRIEGEGEGAHRVGIFSTGIADERVTVWRPGRTLAFRVIHQPPAMEEMSPYRKLHTPHLVGYFDTGETRFDLAPLPGGRTRLTATADHVLRIDPAPYWEPIARWAIKRNVTRVLTDIRTDAEARAKTGRQKAQAAAHSSDGHTA